MKIAVAADHAGWKDKTWLAERLRKLGHEVTDFGTDSAESCDYPDFAVAVGTAVADGHCDQAVLVCGTGVGMSIVANKVKGVRAAACQCVEAARYGRAHNDANVLCMGSRLTDRETMAGILDTWLGTPFEGGRHERRVNKIKSLDQGRTCP